MKAGAELGARSARDVALIVRRFPFGESSLVVHALTRRHGRVHLLAKGAYRMRSRLFGVLDLFDTLELTWTERPAAELFNLEDAQLLERRQRIAHSLESYRSALTMLELASLAAPERAACTELFELCRTSLDALGDARSALLALVEFELAFLHNLGLAPALEACASCGGAAPAKDTVDPAAPRVDFSAAAGGRLCADCAQRVRESAGRVGTMPVDVLEFSAALRRSPGARAAPTELVERAHDFAARFLRHQLDCQPKSFRVFLSAPHRNRREAPRETGARGGDAW